MKLRNGFWLGVALSLAACWESPSRSSSVLEWTMVHVNTNLQGDAHLIRYPSGEVHLIDVGNNDTTLVKALAREGVDVVQQVIVTHPHKDHYGGLEPLDRAPVKVLALTANPVDLQRCRREIPWGCDGPHYQQLLSQYRARGIPVRSVRRGDVLYAKGPTKLEVVFAHDGASEPVGNTDINDTSLILKLTHFTTSILFTGDLNEKLGAYLTEHHSSDLRADLLKVPHHGGIGIAPLKFFEAVRARAAFVPSPEWLWKTPRTQRVRTFLKETQTPFYVNGLHGDIKVLVDSTGYRVGAGIPTPAP